MCDGSAVLQGALAKGIGPFLAETLPIYTLSFDINIESAYIGIEKAILCKEMWPH